MADTVAALGGALGGKVVIDATNNMGGGSVSSVDAIAAAAPDADVYRAFNTLGWENFADPTFGGVHADLFYAGPDGPSQATAERLIADVGLRPIRIGGADKVPLLDSVLRLWFALASEQGMGRHLAFKVLTP
jgi:predicted dinucleotide-binding enzyme